MTLTKFVGAVALSAIVTMAICLSVAYLYPSITTEALP